ACLGTYTHPMSCHATLSNRSGDIMIRRFIAIAALATTVALPVVAQAQGIPGGVERGSREGERAAGPVGAVVGGAVLPEQGVTYYDVPQEYGARDYRYTVVNNRTVLVDPRTRRIVEVVE